MTPTIVIVEDDPSDQALILRALEQAGVGSGVVVMNDGVEVLEWVLAHVPPRLILLDLDMPRLSGKDVLRRLRRLPNLAGGPVVVLSGSSEPRDIAAMYALGANGYVEKPHDSSTFRQRVAEVGRYWGRINEVA